MDKVITERKLYGRTITVQNTTRKGVKWRYLIEGVMHQGGKLPIRFKSFERASNHVVNMMRAGLLKDLTPVEA